MRFAKPKILICNNVLQKEVSSKPQWKKANMFCDCHLGPGETMMEKKLAFWNQETIFEAVMKIKL